MQALTKQIILVTGCIAIGAGLWFGDKKGNQTKTTAINSEPKKMETESVQVIEWDRFLDSTIANFGSEKKAEATKLLQSLKSTSDLTNLKPSAESLISLFEQEKNAPAMAYVRELLAGKTHESADWQNTGKEYYRAAQTVAQEWRNALYQKAIIAFEQALKGKPNNPELLTSIGVCYVEGSAEPMKGIGYLRNAIEVDSTFAEAHFQLGLFAIQSGQFDKAESRMKKVLELKPSFISAHLYLGQIYQQTGQKSKALESLQKYKDLNSDPLIRAEVDKYLQELKNT